MNGNKKDRKYFVIFCCLSIVLVGIIFGINSILRGTNASFGGITGELTVTYKVTYYSNWPDENMENISNEYNGKKVYQVLNNMFEVPNGYEFLGWSIEPNGEIVYSEGYVMNLSSELNLYAIWGMVSVEKDTDENVVMYGDTNLDDLVNEDDYLLIDSYILDNSLLSGQGLVNADVNIDGKVDNIDSDIIKQVWLGTDGYVGFLPEKPILIYDIYVKDEFTDDNDTTDGDNNNNNDNNDGGNSSSGNSGGSSGTGSGNNGTGNSNSGSGTGGKKPSNNNSNKKPNVNSNNENNNKEENKPIEEELPKVYEFKFMDGTNEYAITKCDVLDDRTCQLVLPNTVPSKAGYVFSGWSLKEGCDSKIIKESMNVISGGTYYACYDKVFVKEEKKDNTFNTLMIVFGIWSIVSILIYRLIKQFKNKENN